MTFEVDRCVGENGLPTQKRNVTRVGLGCPSPSTFPFCDRAVVAPRAPYHNKIPSGGSREDG